MSHLVTLADSLPLSPAFHLMPHCFLWVRTVLKTFGMTQVHNYSKIYDQGRLDCHGSHFSSKNVAVLASFLCVLCKSIQPRLIIFGLSAEQKQHREKKEI